nr:fimbrillin family protein [Parabacteroides goldsteinii]
MKRLNYIFFLLLSGIFALLSCSGNELQNDDMHDASMRSFAVSFSDGSYKENNGMQTRATIDGYPTFIAGDKIGLFATEYDSELDDYVVVDDINNLCLTAVDDGNDGINWEVENGSKLMREDVTYWAYFPYRVDFNDNYNVYGNEDYSATSFFQELTNAYRTTIWSTDQSTDTKYKACDIMVAKGSILNKKISFTMEHCAGLMIMDLPAGASFFNCSPYKGNDGRYYYLVEYNAVVVGEYTNADNVKVRWRFGEYGEDPSEVGKIALDPGYYHLFTVDGGSTTH